MAARYWNDFVVWARCRSSDARNENEISFVELPRIKWLKYYKVFLLISSLQRRLLNLSYSKWERRFLCAFHIFLLFLFHFASFFLFRIFCSWLFSRRLWDPKKCLEICFFSRLTFRQRNEMKSMRSVQFNSDTNEMYFNCAMIGSLVSNLFA